MPSYSVIMKGSLALLGALSTAVKAQTHGEEASQEMGPVAFMWPPDRTWGAAYDNTAPCGSNSGVSNRTEFPLVNGQLALVVQDESWNVQIAISHRSNPTSSNDFTTVVSEARISDIDPGHMCYAVPNPGINTEEGMNATFQITYTSDFDTDKNETYYACADVSYIPASRFTYQVPCFNVTADEFEPVDGDSDDDEDSSSNSDSGSGSNSGSGSSSGSTSDTNTESSGGGGGGLSGGAIAGIVVGAVVAAAIALILLFGYRRLLQKYRTMRQITSVRNVDWAADEAGKPAADNESSSSGSIGLRKIR